nr:hypothetical protein [Tanacetum cinerariifolium]
MSYLSNSEELNGRYVTFVGNPKRGKFDGKVDEGFLVGYSVCSKAFRVFNRRTRIVQDTLHINFLENKPNVAGIQEQFDAENAGEENVQQYVLFPVWNLSAEFEDFSNNNVNEINATDTPVPAVGDVGAEANFTNLETLITVSPILTTSVHKDHHVTQIIGDLSSATQTRSMIRVAKDQGGLSQINNDDFHTFRNKALLVAQGYTQEDGINYEEVFAPVARIEAIRLFLAYVSFMRFMVYQTNVKSALLYGTIEKEVYICQPPGFEDPDYPDKVYKVVKALYGLHQAPRAWQKGDILLVQIYVDDIIFGSTNKDLCKAFEKLMKDKFQMSSMGELTFFLDGKSAGTPIDTEKLLLKDPDGEDVDVHTYRLMIVAYSDSDYAGASLDMKSTTGECQFFGCRLISWQCKKQTIVATSSTEAEYVAA